MSSESEKTEKMLNDCKNIIEKLPTSNFQFYLSATQNILDRNAILITGELFYRFLAVH